MHEPVAASKISDKDMLRALGALRKGDFSVRLPIVASGSGRLIAEAFNDVVDLSQAMMQEFSRLAAVVGKEGKITQRGKLANARGGWQTCVESVNGLIDDMAYPATEVQRVIGAVAKGDL